MILFEVLFLIERKKMGGGEVYFHNRHRAYTLIFRTPPHYPRCPPTAPNVIQCASVIMYYVL